MSPRKKKSPVIEESPDEADRAIAAQIADAMGGDSGETEAEAAAIAFALARVTANPEPDPIVLKDAAPPVVGPPCALEGAPVGAKCVVSRTDSGKVARLLTPKGAEDLDKSDLFYTLPAGAKVQKVSETRFDVFRLGVTPDAIFSAGSAREAVRRFLEVVV